MALFLVKIKENVIGKFKESSPVLAVHKTNTIGLTLFLIPDNDGNGTWVDSQGCIILEENQ